MSKCKVVYNKKEDTFSISFTEVHSLYFFGTVEVYAKNMDFLLIPDLMGLGDVTARYEEFHLFHFEIPEHSPLEISRLSDIMMAMKEHISKYADALQEQFLKHPILGA